MHVLFGRLLHVQNGYCRFEEAERTYNQAMQLVKRLQSAGATPNLSSLYSEFSTLYMLRSNYAEVRIIMISQRPLKFYENVFIEYLCVY